MKSTKIEVLKVPDNHALAAERYAGHKFNVGWFSVLLGMLMKLLNNYGRCII